jgi:hypothetical protein
MGTDTLDRVNTDVPAKLGVKPGEKDDSEEVFYLTGSYPKAITFELLAFAAWNATLTT